MEEQQYLKELEVAVGVSFTACESSNILGYGYDKAKKELWIAFKRGNNVYQYSEITESEFKSLQLAESKGKWVNKHLVQKTRKYQRYVFE